MAVVNGKVYSNDKNMLTLTNKEYENLQETAKGFKIYITETRIFAHFDDNIIKTKKDNSLPRGIICPSNTITNIIFKDNKTIISSECNSVNHT
jgi:hypothetical protein